MTYNMTSDLLETLQTNTKLLQSTFGRLYIVLVEEERSEGLRSSSVVLDRRCRVVSVVVVNK
jgi:hypothetical protein